MNQTLPPAPPLVLPPSAEGGGRADETASGQYAPKDVAGEPGQRAPAWRCVTKQTHHNTRPRADWPNVRSKRPVGL